MSRDEVMSLLRRQCEVVDSEDNVRTLSESDVPRLSTKPWHIHFDYIQPEFREWRINDIPYFFILEDKEESTYKYVLSSKVLVQHMVYNNLITANMIGESVVVRSTDKGKEIPTQMYE